MAVRKPLYYDSGNLREMSDLQVAQIRERMYWSYLSNPSVALTVVGSGGSLGTITDTRLQAGAYSTNPSSTPGEATTDEPTIVNVAIDRIQQTVATDPNPSTTPTQYPAYYTSSGQIRSMDLQDMYDTFATAVHGGFTGADGSTVYPSLINTFIYKISTATSLAGYTPVTGPDGSTIIPVFTDTRADIAAYDSANIPEELDQPTTIQNYYLHKINTISVGIATMVRVNSSGNIVAMTTAAVDTAIGAAIRYMVQAETSYKIRYSYGINGSGTGLVCGDPMTDSRLDGTGNYQTLFAGADDYRAQEFPDGSGQVINVYTLKSRLE
jgi:hypothetical protein